MNIIGYKLRYKCMKHTDYNEIICDNMREALGYLGDMKRYLDDYKIITLIKQSEFTLCSD